MPIPHWFEVYRILSKWMGLCTYLPAVTGHHLLHLHTNKMTFLESLPCPPISVVNILWSPREKYSQASVIAPFIRIFQIFQTGPYLIFNNQLKLQLISSYPLLGQLSISPALSKVKQHGPFFWGIGLSNSWQFRLLGWFASSGLWWTKRNFDFVIIHLFIVGEGERFVHTLCIWVEVPCHFDSLPFSIFVKKPPFLQSPRWNLGSISDFSTTLFNIQSVDKVWIR